MRNDKKIALVLGWGGVKCAAAVGFMRVLSQEGIEIDLVVGSGAGSLYGSLLALGFDAEETNRIVKRLWSNETTSKANPMAILQILFPKFFRMQESYYLRDDHLVNNSLFDALGESQFSETMISLFITATDYRSGEQVIISEGSIFDAVRASIALPVIFKPVKSGKRRLVDGFLTGPLPVGVAMQEGADVILAMGFDTKKQVPFDSIANYIMNLVGIMSNNWLISRKCAEVVNWEHGISDYRTY